MTRRALIHYGLLFFVALVLGAACDRGVDEPVDPVALDGQRCGVSLPNCPIGQECVVIRGSSQPPVCSADPCRDAGCARNCYLLESYPAQVVCSGA